MIFRDGWYYLLVTHGTCCAGGDSTYNIRMGRAKKVTGPFLDNMGVDMLQGGGKLFLGSGGRVIGPGHFGLLDLGDGVQKFSCHYEADLDRGGVSVLDIRPLLWRDGWPVAGENVKDGTYEIESARTGTALEMAVEGVPVGGCAAVRRGAPVRAARRAGRGWPTGRPDGAGARGAAGPAPPPPDSAAGGGAGLGELAGWAVDVAHVSLPAAGAAEVDDYASRERRRLSWLAVLQNHDRRHRPRAGRDRGRRTGGAASLQRRARTNCGESTSFPTGPIASCRSATNQSNRWPFQLSGSSTPRSPSSIPKATSSAGI